jgi:hypothetical protein
MRAFIFVSLVCQMVGLFARAIVAAIYGTPRQNTIDTWEDSVYFVIATLVCVWAAYLLWF